MELCYKVLPIVTEECEVDLLCHSFFWPLWFWIFLYYYFFYQSGFSQSVGLPQFPHCCRYMCICIWNMNAGFVHFVIWEVLNSPIPCFLLINSLLLFILFCQIISVPEMNNIGKLVPSLLTVMLGWWQFCNALSQSSSLRGDEKKTKKGLY